jgi:hypothetical protein
MVSQPVCIRIWDPWSDFTVRQLQICILYKKSKSRGDWRSVSQCILVLIPVWGSRPDACYCLTVAVLSLWDVTITVTKVWSYVTTDSQLAVLSWCQAPVCGPWPDFYCCQTVADFLCGAPSLVRGWACSFNCCWTHQRSHSRVRVPQESWPYFTVSNFRLLQPGGPGPYIYTP